MGYCGLLIPGVLPAAQAMLSPVDADLSQALTSPGSHPNDPGQWKEDGSVLGSGVSGDQLTGLPAPMGWEFSEVENGWIPRAVGAGEANSSPSELKIVTWNVMIDNYDKFVPGIIHSGLRYQAVLQELIALDADIVSINEANPAFLKLICSNPWIRQQYVMTDIAVTAAALSTNTPAEETFRVHGVVMLVRRSLCVTSFHLLRSEVERTQHKVVANVPARPSVCCCLTLQGKTLAIIGAHLEAYNTRFRQRRQQLRDIYRAVRLAGHEGDSNPPEDLVHIKADQAMVLGDFNLHQEAENVVIEAPFFDVWSTLRPDATEEESYTWDAQVNSLLTAMWLGCDVRRMRLDRVILSANKPDAPDFITPTDIRIIGNSAIVPAAPGDPDWLFPSDHFGLSTTLRIGPSNGPSSSS